MPPPIEWKAPNTAPRAAPAKALAAWRQAVAARPDSGEFRLMLARMLYDRGLYGEIEPLLAGDLGTALEAQADYQRGRAALQLKDGARAVALLRRAVEAALSGANGELATALRRTGKADEAIAAARHGLKRDPVDIACCRVLGTTLLERGRADEAYAFARDLWARGIHRTQVVWTLAFAARMLGRDEEFAILTAREPWFAQLRLALDDAALAREILANDTLTESHAYKPTKGGVLRIDDFESVAGPEIARFHQAVRDAVANYRASRGGWATHPAIAGWPRRMALDSWALAMNDSGFEDWHIHAGAWLSGVYYVRVPRGTGTEGCIGFGALPAAARLAGTPVAEWTLAPEPGALILFPSWYAHRTWPTGSTQTRISIAFNAQPA
ncbi:MAG TPA: putative 2OG-Fe(II) oxygenase [Rhizomicrobium sp.]